MDPVFACGVPLAPDEGEARSWLEEELSRGIYNTDASGITDVIRRFLTRLYEAIEWKGEGPFSFSVLVTLLAIIAIALVIIALILNPIRSSWRTSHSVFEEEASREDVRRLFNGAVEDEDWNLAYVWAYRLLVLGLDECEVVTSSPGLTAREAAVAATRLVPEQGPTLAFHARTFDRVRYGNASVSRQDVDALSKLTPALLDACRKAQDH